MAQLILIRHGQSMWNKKNLFTGWVDVPLTKQGIEEAVNAGTEIASISFDRVFTSTLIRAQTTAMLVLAQSLSGKTPVVLHESQDDEKKAWFQYESKVKEQELPVRTAWQLNERYYGQLQGLDKAETKQQYGEEQVKIWRRSYDTPPPEGEALKNTAERTLPYFHQEIKPLLNNNENVLIVAHGNSLRSIIMELDQLSESEVLELEIATGVPRYYEWEQGKPKFIK